MSQATFLNSISEQSSLVDLGSVPSFVDLKAFAEEPFEASAGVNNLDQDPFLRQRRALPLPEGPVEIGVIQLSPGSGAVTELVADEFIFTIKGKLSLTQDEPIVLGKSSSLVLLHGCSFTWHCEETTTLIYMRYNQSTPSENKIVPINLSAMLEPSGAPLAELLVGPTPSCRNHTDYLSFDNQFVCGCWDSSPYHRLAMKYKHYEFMYLLEGSVTFIDELGRKGTFVEGDVFLVQQGAQCSWESLEYVKKVYAIFRPA